MDTSPEYQTFKLHYDELKTGLDPSSVVGKAFARDLLSSEERNAASHKQYTDDEKLDKLLGAVDRRIAVDKQAFHTFMDVLEEEPAFQHLVDKLKDTYQSRLYHTTTQNGNGRSSRGGRRPSQQELLKHVKTTKWYRLGLELKLDEDSLAFIEEDCKRDSPGALTQVFKTWLDECEDPTWLAMVNALREVGDKRKAKDLEDKFC